MARVAVGQPDISKLSSGVAHTQGETRNLGELFEEAKKKYGKPKKQNKIRKKDFDGKIIRESGILGVTKNKGLKYKQKFFFKFTFKDENGRVHSRQRRTLRELYDIVQELGYDFEVVDVKTAIVFFNSNCSRKDYNFFCDELCLTKVVSL